MADLKPVQASVALIGGACFSRCLSRPSTGANIKTAHTYYTLAPLPATLPLHGLQIMDRLRVRQLRSALSANLQTEVYVTQVTHSAVV
jgi:hypothetical protein